MGYLSKIECAIKLGYSVELVEYFLLRCPKTGDNRKLVAINSPHGSLIEENELFAFREYLNKPWPLPPKGTRPSIPQAIKDDIKQECHFTCAICGNMNNGELAHIYPVSETLNNSPDNLLYLCPNHHVQYDLGYKPSNNLTTEDVLAVKKTKQMSRRRMLLYESNSTKCLRAIIELITKLEHDLKKDLSPIQREVAVTEVQALLKDLPRIISKAEEKAAADVDIEESEKELIKIAPSLQRAAAGVDQSNIEADIREKARAVIFSSRAIIIEIDETECPHCGGNGQQGWAGSLCSYCGGSCFVSKKEAEGYDKDKIDEVECPRCNGGGQTGLVGDFCTYCKGDGFVTRTEAEDYSEEEIDQIACPLCQGTGQRGLVGSLCPYCGGSCFVSKKEAEGYDKDKINEVECPRCNGGGQTGLVGDLCAYCKGDGFVTRKESEEYDPDNIDEIECPRCKGKGQTGFVGDLCALCKGSSVVSGEVRNAYIDKYGG